MQPTELRPRAIGEILDAAFKIYRSHFKLLVGLAAVVIVPLGVLQLFLIQPQIDFFLAAVDPTFADPNPDQTMQQAFSFLGSILGVAALAAAGQILVQAATVHAVSETYAGRSPVFGASIRRGGAAFFVLVGAWLIALVPIFAGFLFCILPGIALVTMWSMTTQAIVVERTGPARSLSRSWNLVKSRFWPVLGAIALTYLITSVVQSIPGILAQAFIIPQTLESIQTGVPTTPSGTAFVVTTLAGSLVSLFVYPYTATVYTILYYDLRIRKEAFDLERMMAALDQPALSTSDFSDLPPPPPSPPGDPFGLPPPE